MHASPPLPSQPEPSDCLDAVGAAVAGYQADNDMGALQRRLAAIAAAFAADELVRAVEPYRHIPEVAGPVYERVVAERPDDARALVILANSYWLAGRGPDIVGELATRALAADPANRGAWHLWALSEGDPRARLERWRQVSARFPADDLARANVADNAASVAGAEGDGEALALAVETYESLLATATTREQRSALTAAIQTLRGWRL